MVQWQKIDPSNGHVFPWFVHPCLEVISKWDWSQLTVLEYGSGDSTAWLEDKCKKLTSVESDPQWFQTVKSRIKDPKKVNYILAEVNEGDQVNGHKYVNAPDTFKGLKYDVIIVDGIMRFECIEKAIKLKPKYLIVDNWQQSYVFMCPKAEELLKGFKQDVYEQTDHTDNDGVNKWKTAIFHIQ